MTVLIRNTQRKNKIDVPRLRRQTQAVLDQLGYGKSELSLLIVNDGRMKKLNTQFRNIAKATDVLSFPQSQDAGGAKASPVLGDVVLSAETARRQARDHHLVFQEELILLAIHGILHLLGMDHERSPAEELRMQRKTRHLFDKIFPGRLPGGTSNFS
jgi:probable rRNA maturation factor